jgi:hypothetical protein
MPAVADIVQLRQRHIDATNLVLHCARSGRQGAEHVGDFIQLEVEIADVPLVGVLTRFISPQMRSRTTGQASKAVWVGYSSTPPTTPILGVSLPLRVYSRFAIS